MTVDEGTPSIGTLGLVDTEGRSPAPVVPTDSEGPPDPPLPGSPEEIRAVRDLVARLRSSWPTIAESVVETTVRSAYDAFRQARVRAYVPILVERRARRVLGSAAGGASPGREREDGERK
jgi:hypothetical protein